MQKSSLLKKYGHRCKLYEPTILEETIPGQSCSIYLRRLYHYMFMICDGNHKTQLYCRTQKKLRQEIRDHVLKYRFTIHPLSRFRVLWEIIMIVVNLIFLIYMPYNFIFCIYPHYHSPLKCDTFMSLIINGFIFTDIVFNFLTGFYDSEEHIRNDYKNIAKNYVTGRFFLDIVSWTSLLYSTQEITQFDLENNYLYISIFFLLRILRLLEFLKYLTNTTEVFHMSIVKTKLLRLFCSMCIILHYATCSGILLESYRTGLVYSIYPTRKSWLTHNGLWNSSKSLIYTTSLYRSTCLLSGSEHDSIHRTRSGFDKEEHLAKILIWFLARIFLATFICLMMTVIRVAYSGKLQYRKKIHKIMQFSEQKQLTPQLTKKLIDYYRFKYRNTITNEDFILRNISMKMRQDIVIGSRMKVIENISFLNDLPQNVLINICAGFTEEIYLPGDVIMQSGTVVDSFYIILTGTVAIYTKSGIEIKHVSDGAYFGEIELIVPNAIAVSTMVALEPCEIFRSHRRDFLVAISAISQYPNVMQRFQYHIDDHIKHNNTIQQLYKQWLQERKENDTDLVSIATTNKSHGDFN